METAKTIAAVILGILILVGVVLLAKFVGDKIREKYLTPKTVVTDIAPTPNLIVPEEMPKTATYSAIPKTGPREFGYFLIIFLLILGSSTLAVSYRKI